MSRSRSHIQRCTGECRWSSACVPSHASASIASMLLPSIFGFVGVAGTRRFASHGSIVAVRPTCHGAALISSAALVSARAIHAAPSHASASIASMLLPSRFGSLASQCRDSSATRQHSCRQTHMSRSRSHIQRCTGDARATHASAVARIIINRLHVAAIKIWCWRHSVSR